MREYESPKVIDTHQTVFNFCSPVFLFMQRKKIMSILKCILG